MNHQFSFCPLSSHPLDRILLPEYLLLSSKSKSYLLLDLGKQYQIQSRELHFLIQTLTNLVSPIDYNIQFISTEGPLPPPHNTLTLSTLWRYKYFKSNIRRPINQPLVILRWPKNILKSQPNKPLKGTHTKPKDQNIPQWRTWEKQSTGNKIISLGCFIP